MNLKDLDRNNWGEPPEYYDAEWQNKDFEDIVHACELCGHEPVTEIDKEANMFICDTCKKKIDSEI